MASKQGLYGSTTEGNGFKASLAELLGSYTLGLAIFGSLGISTVGFIIAGTPIGTTGALMIIGVVLTLNILVFGKVSGAHLNAAITIGLAINGQFPWRYVLPYIAMQTAGWFLAAETLKYWFNNTGFLTVAKMSATLPGDGIDVWRLASAEVALTGVLAATIVGVNLKKELPLLATAIAGAGALVFGILTTALISGGGLNPARSMVSLVESDQLNHLTFVQQLIYVGAPIIGATAGIWVIKWVITAKDPATVMD